MGLAIMPKKKKRNTRRGADDFEVKTSSVPGIGKGLFAKVRIRAEDHIGDYTGEVLTDEEFYAKKKYYLSDYNVWVCKDCWIWGEGKKANYVRFINHSEDPNAELVTSTRWKKARVRAVKAIAPGEEIFMSYGSDYWENIEKEKVDC